MRLARLRVVGSEDGSFGLGARVALTSFRKLDDLLADRVTGRVNAGLWCRLFRVMGLSRYWGLLGARNWELIEPFKPVFSTWTQSPSRLVTVNCVPRGAVPRTGAFPEGCRPDVYAGTLQKDEIRVRRRGGSLGRYSRSNLRRSPGGERGRNIGRGTTPDDPRCQSASKFDPRSASNFDPLERRVRVVAVAPSELVGVAETARARVGV